VAVPWLETRTSLIVRLRHHADATSWEQFVDAYGRIIHTLALRAGLGPEDAEDATQDALATLARLLPEFRYNPARGSFKSWVLTIARSKIIDTHRRRHAAARFEPPPPSQPDETSFLDRIPDVAQLPPDEIVEQTWRQGLLDAAREQVRFQLSPKQYQIYDLHVVQEWSVDKVTESLQVSANQVYLAKHRVGEAIATEVARLAQGDLG
jgi:RNA polymerase sigma-70 factor (ECF subfamily)